MEDKTVPKVSIKRIALFFTWLLASVAGLVVVLVLLVSVADIIRWHGFRRGFVEDPGMKVFPTPLSDTSLIAVQRITTITESGCSIDLPWPNVTVSQGRFARLPDGRATFFTDPATTTDEAGIYREVFGGDSTFQSNYDYLAAQLNFSPAELTELPWGRRHQRQILLAFHKSTLMLTQKYEPIYSVALRNVRGFQFGDANQTYGFVELRMFDPKDRQFTIHIVSGASHVPWTQSEINFIIHSMHCDDATYSAARQAWDSRIHQRR
jgi:hypothetical protein